MKKQKKKKKKKTKKKVEESKSSDGLNVESDEEERLGEAYKEMKRAQSDEDGILPDIRDHLENFKKVITWKKVGKKNVPEPVKGLSQEFDSANDKVEDIKSSIQDVLNKTKKELQLPEIKYYTASKRFRFEIQIPIKNVESLPSKYTLTSKAKKCQRFHTPELTDLVEQLEDAEDELREAISPFLTKLFRKFYKKQYLWSDFVS